MLTSLQLQDTHRELCPVGLAVARGLRQRIFILLLHCLQLHFCVSPTPAGFAAKVKQGRGPVISQSCSKRAAGPTADSSTSSYLKIPLFSLERGWTSSDFIVAQARVVEPFFVWYG